MNTLKSLVKNDNRTTQKVHLNKTLLLTHATDSTTQQKKKTSKKQ